MWTGGRPDELTAKYAKGADLFVTEMAGLDLGFLLEQKYGIPRTIVNFTIDTHHTATTRSAS